MVGYSPSHQQVRLLLVFPCPLKCTAVSALLLNLKKLVVMIPNSRDNFLAKARKSVEGGWEGPKWWQASPVCRYWPKAEVR